MVTRTPINSFEATLPQRIERVIEAHRATANAAETMRRQPNSVFQAMHDAGLFALFTPKQYGGEEVHIGTFMHTVETLTREDSALGWSYCVPACGPLMTAYLPAGGADDIVGVEPNCALPGSVVPAGRAVPVQDGYRLTGRWPLASGIQYGDWVGCTGLVFDGDMPRMGPNGMPDIHSFFVPHDACTFIDTWDSLGLRGTGSIDFTVDDVFIPADHAFSLFTTPPTVEGPMYRAGPMALFSLSVSSVFPGIALHAIDEFIDLAKRKTPTLSQTGLATRTTIHAEVARAKALVESSRAYLYQAANDLMTAVTEQGYLPDDIEAERRLACVNVAEACIAAVDIVHRLAGSSAVFTGNPIERALRDIHTASQHLIVSPVWWEKTGQYYFGLGLGMP